MGVYVGTLGAPSGTGNSTVTGIPFQPVAVVFWNVKQHEAPFAMMLGAATADDEQWVMWAGVDSETSGYFKRYSENRTDACIFMRFGSASTIDYQAEFVGFTADGFTINVTTFNSAGENIEFMALGGNNIGQCYAGTITAGASTGTTATTDPGFRPAALIMGHQAGTVDDGRTDFARWGTGVTDGTNQYSSFIELNVGTGVDRHIHRTDSLACATAAAGDFKLELDTFDANGFTVNVTDAHTGNVDLMYLAIDAAAAAAGNGVMPDSTGTADLTTPGFEAEGAFFCWNGVNTPLTTGSGTLVELRPGVGATTSSGAGAVSAITRASFPFGVYITDSYSDNAAISVRGQGTGVGPNDNDILHSASWFGATQGTLTIDWDIATTGADRAYGWLALPGDLPFTWTPGIYRRVLAA